MAYELRGKYFELPDNEFQLLITACEQHTNSLSHEDITVQTCFDADRLDLARVGIIPEPDYLCTDMAKSPDLIAWANERSKKNHAPDIVTVWEQ